MITESMLVIKNCVCASAATVLIREGNKMMVDEKPALCTTPYVQCATLALVSYFLAVGAFAKTWAGIELHLLDHAALVCKTYWREFGHVCI